MYTVNQVDLDALQAARKEEWDRLDALGRTSRLSGPDVDELIVRYQSASADLAEIKTSAGKTPLGAWLSIVLGRARLRLTGTPDNPLQVAGRFFTLQLPAALYRVRWLTLAVTLSFIGIVAITALWGALNPGVIDALGNEAQLETYAREDFVNYYSENPPATFATMVWTNNAWIAAQCVLFGITGIWPAYVLMLNATGLGISGAVMFAHDRGDVFLLYLAPHGLLELTAIFVAGAAGFRIFWAVVAPGHRRRLDAIARAGMAMVTISIGLVFALALSGLVEGYVTRQPWPWWIKIGIGALALGIFLFYMLVVGKRAVRLGEDGSMTEYEQGTERLVAG